MGISGSLQVLAVLEQLKRVTIRAKPVREQGRELAAVGAEHLHAFAVLLAPVGWLLQSNVHRWEGVEPLECER